MCRMLGMMCNDADLLPCAVLEVKDSLALGEAQSHDGVGIGSYSNDDPLLKRMPSREEDSIDFASMVEGIASNALLIHVRRATVGAWKTDNTHPFRFRRWLFGHVGHLPGTDAMLHLPGRFVRFASTWLWITLGAPYLFRSLRLSPQDSASPDRP